MLDFDNYVARYGESAIQAIIERLECYENIRASLYVSLEDRWNYLMNDNAANQHLAA